MSTVVVGGYEWDRDKAAENFAKHRVSFEDAIDALEDEAAVELADLAHPDRAVTIGFDQRARILVVVTTERGDRTRIISARKATNHEESIYASGE